MKALQEFEEDLEEAGILEEPEVGHTDPEEFVDRIEAVVEVVEED